MKFFLLFSCTIFILLTSCSTMIKDSKDFHVAIRHRAAKELSCTFEKTEFDKPDISIMEIAHNAPRKTSTIEKGYSATKPVYKKYKGLVLIEKNERDKQLYTEKARYLEDFIKQQQTTKKGNKSYYILFRGCKRQVVYQCLSKKNTCKKINKYNVIRIVSNLDVKVLQKQFKSTFINNMPIINKCSKVKVFNKQTNNFKGKVNITTNLVINRNKKAVVKEIKSKKLILTNNFKDCVKKSLEGIIFNKVALERSVNVTQPLIFYVNDQDVSSISIK